MSEEQKLRLSCSICFQIEPPKAFRNGSVVTTESEAISNLYGGQVEVTAQNSPLLPLPTSLTTNNSTTLMKGVLWQQREKRFSRWKERFFVISNDYLQCYRKGTSKISEMGGFIYRIRLSEVSLNFCGKVLISTHRVLEKELIRLKN